MKKKTIILVTTMLISGGCAQLKNSPFLRADFLNKTERQKIKSAPKEKPRKPADYILYFTLQSDPSGASVYFMDGNKTNYLGNTPIRFPLELTKRSLVDVLKGAKKPLWEAFTLPDRPLEITQTESSLIIETPDLWMASTSHKPQQVSEKWTLPIDLKERKAAAWPQVVPLSYSKTAVLSTPAKPQLNFSVVVESRPPGAKLYLLEPNGSPGELVSALPMKFDIGMAGIRSRDNTVTNWIRWSNDLSKGLWTHTDTGELRINGVLSVDGYQPEVIRDRAVALASSSANGKEFKVILEPGIPSAPQKELAFTIDSLPSGSAVYELREDGALGAKVGQTPFRLPIGLAQELKYDSSLGYVHKDWRIWSPNEILKWQVEPSGETMFRLSFALYKDGFAVETVNKPVFTLKPGEPFPEGTTLTFPLLTPEQATARESRDLQRDLIQIQGAAAARGNWANDPDWLMRTATGGADARQTDGYVWSGPSGDGDTTNNTTSLPLPWWKKILPRR